MTATERKTPTVAFVTRRDGRIGRQGGYVGLIVLLLAVLIVGWLAKDALKAYLSPAPPARSAAPDPAGAAPVLTAPMDRARAVGDLLKAEEGKRDGGN